MVSGAGPGRRRGRGGRTAQPPPRSPARRAQGRVDSACSARSSIRKENAGMYACMYACMHACMYVCMQRITEPCPGPCTCVAILIVIFDGAVPQFFTKDRLLHTVGIGSAGNTTIRGRLGAPFLPPFLCMLLPTLPALFKTSHRGISLPTREMPRWIACSHSPDSGVIHLTRVARVNLSR